MKVYKLKHKPTGLFYTPSRGSGNLSKTGKLYTTIPSIKWADMLRIKIHSFNKEPKGHHKIIVDYFNLDWNNGWIDQRVQTKPQHWEIVEL